jgi:hypothetical protein
MNWLRQMGVLLASKGLEVYCTLRLLMDEPRQMQQAQTLLRHLTRWRNA